MSKKRHSALRAFVSGTVIGVWIMVFAGLARAQVDIVVRPTAAIVKWGAEIAPRVTENQTTPVEVCLVTCAHAADIGSVPVYAMEANRFRCIPLPDPYFGIAVTGEMANPYGQGDLCVRAITVSADSKVSLPSGNSLTVLDLPPTPVMFNPGPVETP